MYRINCFFSPNEAQYCDLKMWMAGRGNKFGRIRLDPRRSGWRIAGMPFEYGGKLRVQTDFSLN